MARGRGTSQPTTSVGGRFSTRSDDTPKPVDFNAEAHGDRQAFSALQAADGGASPAPGGAVTPPSGPPGAAPLQDVFAPSEGGEAQPASMTIGENGELVPEDPDLLLRVLYTKFPHPDILRLLQRRGL